MSVTDAGSYGYKSQIAQAGQLGDVGPKRIDSKAAQATIGFGLGVKLGTDPEKQVVRIDNASDTFFGVAVFDHTKEQGFNRASSPSSTGASYLTGDAVAVLREGRVYVEAVGSVTAGAAAYCVPASGKFTTTSASMVGPVGRFVDSGGEGDIVAVDIIR
jgi:hypothetical protein